MNEIEKKVSSIASASLDLLLIKHPARTSLGVVFGLSISFLVAFFKPVFEKIEFIDATAIPIWGWMPIGILLAHLPNFLWNIFNRPVVKEEIDELIHLIDKGDFSKPERRQQYRLLINKALEQVVLNSETQKKILSVKQEVEHSKFKKE